MQNRMQTLNRDRHHSQDGPGFQYKILRLHSVPDHVGGGREEGGGEGPGDGGRGGVEGGEVDVRGGGRRVCVT